MRTQTTAKRIAAGAQGVGYVLVSSHTASTGTVYLTLSHPDIDDDPHSRITVRVADHAEAYPPAKRGERKLLVSPVELDAAGALQILLRGAKCVEVEYPAELTDFQLEYIKDQKRRCAEFKSRWQDIRARLDEDTWNEWKFRGRNRRAARGIAKRLGLGAAYVYAALTNGRKL